MCAGVMVIGTNADGIKEIIIYKITRLMLESDDVSYPMALLFKINQHPEMEEKIAEKGK
jgi:hypothetical protein